MARVLVDMFKPLQRGIMLKKDKSSLPPEWFAIQYENLPFFCFSCGLIGHLENSCPDLQLRDAEGKLPYELKKLHAPDDRRRMAQSFAQAVVESFGSSSGPGKSRCKTRCYGSPNLSLITIISGLVMHYVP
jgi:hypothetical protein